MLLERIESEGLAHYSYIIGDGQEAVVIDPRRDCDIYLEKATQAGMRLAHILETHRNEDYLIGSAELASRTDAQVWHADSHLDYKYGQPVEDGQTWQVGRLRLQAIHTPGHTLGHMSYLLRQPDGEPWVVFSGDALFAGDVGRVDFMGQAKLEEMAGLLYESLFNKLLPLGDQVIVCPAHGSGSACGASIADRSWTTIGLERRLSPKLQSQSQAEFVAQVAVMLEYPPYFAQMERLNLEGAPILGTLPVPKPLATRDFASQAQGAIVLDTRMELGFCAGHVPQALSIWLEGVPSFAGWFLPFQSPILLVGERDDPSRAVRYLLRIGYDEVRGYLSGGMLSWHTAGRESRSLRTIQVREMCRLLDARQEAWILDVRSHREVASASIPGAHHIHLTQLPSRLSEVPRDRPVYIFCGSGLRATVAASLLEREGWTNLVVVLGGISGWASTTCPIQRP